jgi:predicted methyltransferase
MRLYAASRWLTLVPWAAAWGAISCGGSPPPRSAPAPTHELALPQNTHNNEAELAQRLAQVEAEREYDKLLRDLDQLRQEDDDELRRLTPELRAEAKDLAEATKPSTYAALPTILSGNHRRPGHAQRDMYQHPRETLEFLGIEPYHSVLEVNPDNGWYTELLAPLLFRDGKLFVAMNDPAGPSNQRSSFYGKRTKLFLEALPEMYSRVEKLIVDPKSPRLALNADELDVAFVMLAVHMMIADNTFDRWLAELHRTIKPGGTLAIVQHRSPDDVDVYSVVKDGYVPEEFVIDTVTKAGFRLAASSDINTNPSDSKDHPHGVWSLPPTLRGGAKDKYRYIAIGESDRMTLRFTKF